MVGRCSLGLVLLLCLLPLLARRWCRRYLGGLVLLLRFPWLAVADRIRIRESRLVLPGCMPGLFDGSSLSSPNSVGIPPRLWPQHW